MSNVGKHFGTVSEVGQDESKNGFPFYALVIDVPEIIDPLTARFYFSPAATAFSKERLKQLGIDCTKPPMPQLERLVGRTVGVSTRLKHFDGEDRLEVVRVWLATKGERRGTDPIHQILGIEATDEQSGEEWDDVEVDAHPAHVPSSLSWKESGREKKKEKPRLRAWAAWAAGYSLALARYSDRSCSDHPPSPGRPGTPPKPGRPG